MTTRKRALLEKASPWSGQAVWWVLLIEGIVALGLGLYSLIWPQDAAKWLIYILAIFLLVDGIIAVVRAVRQKGGRTNRLVRAGAAIVTGLIVVLMPFLGFGDAQVAAWVMAIGLLVVGVFAILSSVTERSQASRGAEVLWGLAILGLSVVFFYGVVSGAAIVTFVAWVLAAAGAMMIIFAFFARSQAQTKQAAAPPPAAKASAPAEVTPPVEVAAPDPAAAPPADADGPEKSADG